MNDSVLERCRRPGRLGRWLRALANWDVFPDFSARVRRVLYTPLGVLGCAALAALLCGLFLHTQGLVLFGGVAAVILLGVAWPWLGMRGLHGTIAFARSRASEGDAVEVSLTLYNRLPWSAWGLSARAGLGEAVGLAAVPGRREVRCRWQFTPACRGVYPPETPRLASGFPFGLWENGRPLGVEAPLLVWPRAFPVGSAPLVDGSRQVEGNVARNRVGSNGDVLGVRPYRRGDSPRRIHWPQSARHDRLIVCELQSNARPVIQLVLDDDARAHAGHGPDGSREWAIRVVASLATGWLQDGSLIEAVWHGETFHASSGQAHLHRLLDSLAKLPAAGGPALAEVLAGLACRGCGGGLQVIVTTDVGLQRLGLVPPEEWRRWVVLRAEGFGGTAAPPPRPRPWLWIDSAARLPALLRGGWKEARHGS